MCKAVIGYCFACTEVAAVYAEPAVYGEHAEHGEPHGVYSWCNLMLLMSGT